MPKGCTKEDEQIRRRGDCEVLLVRNDDAWAERFRLEGTQWRPAGNVGLPWAMKKSRLARRLTRLVAPREQPADR